jgi:hypothetical protein
MSSCLPQHLGTGWEVGISCLLVWLRYIVPGLQTSAREEGTKVKWQEIRFYFFFLRFIFSSLRFSFFNLRFNFCFSVSFFLAIHTLRSVYDFSTTQSDRMVH